MCVLWFDEILFEDFGRINRENFLASIPEVSSLSAVEHSCLLEAVTPVRERVKLDWQERFRKDIGRGYPRWGDKLKNYDFPEPETPAELAHNILLRKIEMEFGVNRFAEGYDIEQAEGRARFAVDSIDLWKAINDEIPCILQARSDEADVMNVFRSFDRKEELSSSFTLFQAVVPSLRHLSWKSVIDMRRKNKFNPFREKLERVFRSAEEDLTVSLQSLREAEKEVVEEIVERSRPAPGMALIEGVLGNLPTPGINPFSIVFSLKAFARAVQNSERFEWFYMMRDLREM